MVYYNGTTHGTWCNTKTRLTNCRYCGSLVYYFTCDCRCKVFFDELGHPWTEHSCSQRQKVLDAEIKDAIRRSVRKFGIEGAAVRLEIEVSEVKEALEN